MKDEQLIEKLRDEILAMIDALNDEQELITSLKAGQLRIVITSDGIYQERLVPHLDLILRSD